MWDILTLRYKFVAHNAFYVIFEPANAMIIRRLILSSDKGNIEKRRMQVLDHLTYCGPILALMSRKTCSKRYKDAVVKRVNHLYVVKTVEIGALMIWKM